ncbi:NECAP PHear domain-containing protein [Caenorhabditis elegans]|uniref:NECAP PHear domain-containing protein n=1 Tax=Caenorhabditis elegans TaxID=6239 RepID=Q9N489_CAEEL|nr:NECAP PHear domain-containing protein [Caenorhabditis elegans]CCD73702.1 NECAP PHear domain-containing protein [Caenorhabditis elegans]|eukprot:NP_494398.1 NeCAP (NECAP) endocytosis associated protein homolog [Caenorhabditis elegans]
MGDYENVLMVKPKVFVYRIPPIGTSGHKAADWNLDSPAWTGRMRLVAIGKRLEMRLEDGETCDLYAKCPIDAHPGNAIEAVSDSSRYFVIRLQNDNGQQAFVGCGFQERGDAFDFNVTLQDHFRYIERSAELEKQDLSAGPSLDLAFKEGQTISINIGKKDKSAVSRPRPAPGASTGGLVPLLPPPPGAGSMIRNSRPSTTTTTASSSLSSAFAAPPPAPSSSTSTTATSGNLLDF